MRRRLFRSSSSCWLRAGLWSALAMLMTFVVTAALHWWRLAKGIAYKQARTARVWDMFGAFMRLVSPLAVTALAIALD